MIIGIVGNIGKQRDKLATCLASEALGKFDAIKVIAFADKLKLIAKILTGHSDFGDNGKKINIGESYNNVTAGKYLQNLGDAIRSMDEDAFIKAAIISNAEFFKNQCLAIIKDIRRMNELRKVGNIGGIIIKINSKSVKDYSDLRDSNHPSEKELDGYKSNFEVNGDSDEDIAIFSEAFISTHRLKGVLPNYPLQFKDELKRIINSAK